jgi:eukaryotic-like serine/threonine-protein kinase
MSGAETLIGKTLGGRFRVTGFIGEGAMATVYRGVQSEEPREVALKIMHPHLIGDPTFVARFRREAKAAKQIQHPNTVQIVDYGVDGNVLYIAMELLGGQDLFETLVVERRIGEKRAVKILLQVCDALVAAHDKGIVHRDLKPENIMLLPDPADPDGDRVKVLDFGIAKILEREQPPPSDDADPISMASSVLTTVGMVVGTPAYMSPEQCRGETIDARSDVYACGILLYQIVTGRLPFAGDNVMDLAVKHIRTPPPPLAQFVPAVNPGLEQAVLKALSKWPSQRQQSARELRDELAALVPALSDRQLLLTAVAPAAPAPAAAQEAPRRSAQHVLDGNALITLRSAPTEAGPSEPPPTARSVDAGAAVPWAPAAPSPFAQPAQPEATHIPRPAVLDPRFDAGAPTMPAGDARDLPTAPTRALVKARPAAVQGGGESNWLIIPIALIVGVAVGVIAYFLAR